MKYAKMLGLLAVAAAALLAFVGTASALVTSPPGTTYTGKIHATSINTTLHGGFTIECDNSTVEGYVKNGETEGEITELTFSECEPDTVTVTNKGKLKIESNGTVRSTGARVTVIVHRTVFGIPITAHCIYETNNTSVGSLTENVEPAELHIGSSEIPRVATDGSCGSTSTWTGKYTVNTPSGKIVVD